MKSFKQFLQETLTQSQKRSIEHWRRGLEETSLTDHFFGKKQEIIEPFTQQTKSDTHKKIESHLGTEISIPDYNRGIFNSERIKAKLPPELKTLYNADQTRNVKYDPDMHILITRTKEGIAGQTSANQSWENHSCKNFTSGNRKDILPIEYASGVVVSYLKDRQGKELARATFSPCKNENGDTIFKMTSKYGKDFAGFNLHSKELEKRLSIPSDYLSTFKIAPELEAQATDERFLHPHVADDKELLSKILSEQISNGKITRDHFDTAETFGFLLPKHLTEFSSKVLQDLKSGNYSPEHLDLIKTLNQFNKNHENELHSALLKKLKLTPNSQDTVDHISHAIDNGYFTPIHANAVADKLGNELSSFNSSFDSISHAPIISKLRGAGFWTKKHDDDYDKINDSNNFDIDWEPDDHYDLSVSTPKGYDPTKGYDPNFR